MADGRRSRQKQLATSGGVLKRPLTDFDDIVFEILSRLPVKSLLRLRCVCKSWRALISESHFVTKHLNHAVRGIDSNSFSRLFVAHDIFLSIDYESMKDGYLHDSATTEHDFAVMFPHLSINLVLGSCNGLVCLELVQESQLGFVPESQLLYDIVLWNPCTRVSKVLPRPTFDWNSDCLVFYGFGFDSTTDDYKVVWGTSYKSTEVTIIRVFSLKTGSWRTHQGLDYVPLNGRSCLLNGALHWLEHQWVEGELSAVGLRIVSFDLAEEKLQEIMPLPCHPANRKHVIMGVGTSRNCLFVYSNPESDDIDESLNTYFRLWVMKEYGVKESWTEVLKLPSEILPNEDESCLLPLCILENGRVMFDHDGNSLELYNPEDKTFCKIVQAREDWCLKAAVYVETLVSPVTGSGTDI